MKALRGLGRHSGRSMSFMDLDGGRSSYNRGAGRGTAAGSKGEVCASTNIRLTNSEPGSLLPFFPPALCFSLAWSTSDLFVFIAYLT